MRMVGFCGFARAIDPATKVASGSGKYARPAFYGDLVCVVSLPELRPRKRKEGNWMTIRTGAMLLTLSAAVAHGGTLLCERAAPHQLAPGVPRYSDVGMRLFTLRNPEHATNMLAMAKAFHITRAEWSYIKNREFIATVHAQGWTFQGTLAGITHKPEHAMKLKDGQPMLDHFQKPGRYWADMKNEDYRKWYVDQLVEWLDAGMDSLQRDEPTTCRRTPIPVATAFFADMHARFRQATGSLVPMSCNLAGNHGGRFGGPYSDLTKHFTFGMAEFFKQDLTPSCLVAAAREAREHGKALVFTGGDAKMNTRDIRRAIAGCYANGLNYIVPWDQFTGIKSPRLFAKPEDLADLYGFVRACGPYLDGYEEAAVRLPDVPDGVADGIFGGTAFTAFMVSRSKDGGFGLGGNANNGNGGIPRLYLKRGGFNYNTLTGVGCKSEPGEVEIATFMHDGVRTIAITRNDADMTRASHADYAVTKAFGAGGFLCMPFQGANRNHAGDLAEFIVYARALTRDEQSGVRAYLKHKYAAGEAKGTPPDAAPLNADLRLWFDAGTLAGSLKEGAAVTRWPGRTAHAAVVPGVRLPGGKGAAAPVFAATGINGRPCVRFDGVDDLLQVQSAPGQVFSGPLSVAGGSGAVCAFARAMPGQADAPVIVHLVEWSDRPAPCRIHLRMPEFFGGRTPAVTLLTPAAYDRAAHAAAEENARKMLAPGGRMGPAQASAYAPLRVGAALKVAIAGEIGTVEVPALNPWGILVVTPEG
jgi:hypothetical protein